MIRLALILFAYMIPGIIVGFLLLSIFPHIPMAILVPACCVIVAGGFYKYRQKRKEAYIHNDNVHGMPDWIGSNAQNIFLAVITVISGIVIFYTNKTDLYIDNGTDRVVKIKTTHNGTVEVPPYYHLMLTVVKGDIEFEYEGKKRNFKITNDGNWVLNLDSLNKYVRTSVLYSSATTLYKNGTTLSEPESPDMELITEEFFDAKVDYMFAAPETIKIEDSRTGNANVAKKILYRLRDFVTDENTEQAEESVTADSTIVKPKKKN